MTAVVIVLVVVVVVVAVLLYGVLAKPRWARNWDATVTRMRDERRSRRQGRRDRSGPT